MIDISDRIRNEDLKSKIVSAEEVANWIKPGMTIACSGFTASAYPKASKSCSIGTGGKNEKRSIPSQHLDWRINWSRT